MLKAIKSGTKTIKEMVKAQVTIPLGILEVRDMNLSKKQAQAKIWHWIQRVQKSDLPCFDDFLKLLSSWWEEITNYFIQRI